MPTVDQHCPICKSSNTAKVFDDFPGYLEDTAFDIFECNNCDIQFLLKEVIDTSIYDVIYSNNNTPGYDRYFQYANTVINQDKPLQYLSDTESIYYPVYNFLKDKKNLKILEIGSGYGYLTYSMKRDGHDVTGIDISSNAVTFANKQFGNMYLNTELQDYTSDSKFDLIVATELIEHLIDPAGFLENCKSLLKETGTIIISTPNKDYYRDYVWQTDLPPVHTVWMGKKSFEMLAKDMNMVAQFTDFSKHIAKTENKLNTRLRLKEVLNPLPVLNKNGEPFQERVLSKRNPLKNVIRHMIYLRPVRRLSNIFSNMITKEHHTLGILLTKK